MMNQNPITEIMCEYGCGKPAIFPPGYSGRNKKWCCSEKKELCPEQRKLNSQRQKGKVAWNKGLSIKDKRVKKNTERTKKTRKILLKNGTIKIWNKGLTKEQDERIKKYSEKIKISKKGKPNVKLRKPISNLNGSYSYFRYRFKQSLYTSWVFPCLKRDNFLCKKCNTSYNLEVHHLESYRDIFEKSILECNLKSEDWKKWSNNDIENLQKFIIKNHPLEIGLTVCKYCHGEIDESRKRFLQKKYY